MAWDPFPADLWEKGQRKFVCTFEQDVPGTLRFADLTTSKVPLAARVCLNTPRRYRSCAGRHQAEVIGEMTLNQAVAKGVVTGRKAIRTGPDGRYVALSDAQYAKLDKVCQTFLAAVSDVGGGVVGRAYPGEVSQWPTGSGDYVASCFALKPFEPPPMITGTVFDRAAAEPRGPQLLVRCTLCWAACARGRTTSSSMSTCEGSEATQRTHSATSSATSGSATPS